MSKLRIIIGFLAAIGLVTVATAALVPPVQVSPLAAVDRALPARFSERERRDLTPRKTGNTEYSAPQTIGERHRIFVGLAPRSYDVLPSDQSGSPMVVLLHGAGRDGRAMLDMWQEAARKHDLTLVAPNSGGGSWDLDDAQGVLSAISDAQQQYQTDPNRIYLFGHSAGAVIAQVYANYIDGPWRAVATHGGYVQADALQPVKGGVPMRAYLGSSDGIFNPAAARETARAFAKSGHVSEFHLIPEHGHWYYEIGPTLAMETTKWFLTR